MCCQMMILLRAMWAVRAWKLWFFPTLYFQMCSHTALVPKRQRIPYILSDKELNIYLKSSIFWYIMLCSLLNAKKHFGATCHLQLQHWSANKAKNQHKAGTKQWTTWSHILREGTLHNEQYTVYVCQCQSHQLQGYCLVTAWMSWYIQHLALPCACALTMMMEAVEVWWRECFGWVPFHHSGHGAGQENTPSEVWLSLNEEGNEEFLGSMAIHLSIHAVMEYHYLWLIIYV
jgi:hypothetical protein